MSHSTFVALALLTGIVAAGPAIGASKPALGRIPAPYEQSHPVRRSALHHGHAKVQRLSAHIAEPLASSLQPAAFDRPPENNSPLPPGTAMGTAHLDHAPSGLDDNVTTFGLVTKF